MSELLSPSQAAERMGVTVRTVYQYLSDGALEGAYKDERGRWQIPDSALLDLASMGNASPDIDAPGESAAAEPPPNEPPPYELTPEERAARRERERAAALAALYAPDELEALDEAAFAAAVEASQDDPSADFGDEGPAGPGPEAEASAPAYDIPAETLDEIPGEPAYDMPAEALDEIPGEPAYDIQAEALDEIPGEPAYDMPAETLDEIPDEPAYDIQAEALDEIPGEPAYDIPAEALDEIPGEPAYEMPAEALDEIAAEPEPPEAQPELHVEAEPSVHTDDYVMDSVPVPVDSAPVDSTPVEQESVGPDGAPEPAAARAVVVQGAGADLSDVNLQDVDLAKLAAADDATEAVPVKKSGMGCPVMIAILASLLILLVAAFFIANQTLGLFGGADDDIAVVEPGQVETVSGDSASAEAPADAATDTAAPAEQAAAAAADDAAPSAAVIQPAAPGESLVVIPAFAGADAVLNAQLRDAIAEQAAALGVGTLRAEAAPSPLSADQLAEAVDLGAQLQADTVMWGEQAGDQVVVNLLSLDGAGLPAAEAAAVTGDRIQPIQPNASASLAVDDVSAQAAFLAGMAVGQSLMSAGDYTGATAAIQQAVDSVGPGAPPAGLDEAFFRLGWLHQTQQQDPQAALDAYTLALQLNPDHAAALNNIGLVNDNLGDKQQALFFYNRALPLLREAQNLAAEALVLNRIGALYNEIGDVQEALSFYNRALPLTMEAGAPALEAATRRNLALIHKDLGDLDIAEEEMTQAVTLAEAAGLPTLAQDQQALEEIQALRAQQTPAGPVFRNR